MRILVLGGYGLIGLPVVLRLAAAGHDVTGLGRSVQRARKLSPNVAWIEQDIARLTHPDAWNPLLQSVDAVVNCSGALQDGPRDDLQALQTDAMKALFEACERFGVRALVQISAAGVSPEAATQFFRTKAAADEALSATNLAWFILRPGLVIAPNAFGGTAALRALASCPKVMFLIGGDQPIRTVGVHDVVDAVLGCVEGRVPPRSTYDLVEDRTHRLRDVVTTFRAWLGYEPAPVVVLPGAVGRLVSLTCDAIGLLGWRPPLRTTALVQLNSGILGDPSDWKSVTDRAPSSLGETLRRMPSTIQDRWFARLWLLKPLITATLSLFWLASGIIGWISLDSAGALLTSQSIDAGLAAFLVVAGSSVDVALGLSILIRRFHKSAALGMLAATFLYLLAGTFIAPELWLDPLGPFVKTVPGVVLVLVALAIEEDR